MYVYITRFGASRSTERSSLRVRKRASFLTSCSLLPRFDAIASSFLETERKPGIWRGGGGGLGVSGQACVWGNMHAGKGNGQRKNMEGVAGLAPSLNSRRYDVAHSSAWTDTAWRQLLDCCLRRHEGGTETARNPGVGGGERRGEAKEWTPGRRKHLRLRLNQELNFGQQAESMVYSVLHPSSPIQLVPRLANDHKQAKRRQRCSARGDVGRRRLL